MKRIMILILMMVFPFALAACTPEEDTTRYVVLPDLNGRTETDIIALFDDLGLTLDTQSKTYELQFIMYPDHNIGDIVPSTETIRVLLYPSYVSDTMIELPQLTGLREDDIRSMLLGTGIAYYMSYVPTEDETLHGLFAGYVDGHQAGDQFDNISAVGILIHRYGEELSDEYFQVLDLVYDGPYLDPSVIGSEYLSPRGGAFEVVLLACTDGDILPVRLSDRYLQRHPQFRQEHPLLEHGHRRNLPWWRRRMGQTSQCIHVFLAGSGRIHRTSNRPGRWLA
jgi:hypothetical protein